MRYLLLTLVFYCAAFMPLLTRTAWTAQSCDLTIRPEVLDIGTFYSGGKITISGKIPNRQDVIVEIAGPTVNNQFDLKGRVGPFWMTRDQADLDGAPAMYVLLFPEGQQWQRQAAALGLGLEKLRTQISIQSEALPANDLFDMFVELKRSEGLYLVKDNAVRYAPDENGYKQFKARFRFPRATTAGKYTIKATAVLDGALVMEQAQDFVVDEVGFTRLIDNLATHQRLTYGILAVIIALLAGGGSN
jgi:hypothetical protein